MKTFKNSFLERTLWAIGLKLSASWGEAEFRPFGVVFAWDTKCAAIFVGVVNTLVNEFCIFSHVQAFKTLSDCWIRHCLRRSAIVTIVWSNGFGVNGVIGGRLQLTNQMIAITPTVTGFELLAIHDNWVNCVALSYYISWFAIFSNLLLTSNVNRYECNSRNGCANKIKCLTNDCSVECWLLCGNSGLNIKRLSESSLICKPSENVCTRPAKGLTLPN